MPKQEATREPVNAALHDMVNGFLAVRRATAWVEWEDDPRIPGRRAYRITGETKESVQAAVDGRMALVDNATGSARFVGPYRDNGGYIALGEVIIPPLLP